jgi:AcrR family transcriptional regulator
MNAAKVKAKRDEAADLRTRARLLEAAGEVFAVKGFRSTTVREICRRAGANVAAINYYFGDKEKLYGEVLRYAHACAMEKHPPEMDTTAASSAEDRLRAFIVSFLHRLFDNGRPAWHSKLISREMVEPTGALRGLVKQNLQARRERLEQIIGELVGDAGDQRLIRHCVLSIVGQCISFYHARAMLEHLYPELSFEPSGIEERAEYIFRFSLAAILNIEAPRIERKSKPGH